MTVIIKQTLSQLFAQHRQDLAIALRFARGHTHHLQKMIDAMDEHTGLQVNRSYRLRALQTLHINL